MQPFIVRMQLEMLHLLSYSTICKIGSRSNTLVLYMDDRLYLRMGGTFSCSTLVNNNRML